MFNCLFVQADRKETEEQLLYFVVHNDSLYSIESITERIVFNCKLREAVIKFHIVSLDQISLVIFKRTGGFQWKIRSSLEKDSNI